MKLLIFGDPHDATIQACSAGLSQLGHAPIYRNPLFAKPGEVETCDMLVADMRHRGRDVLRVYDSAEIPAICIDSTPLSAAHVCLTLDSWNGVVPVRCPEDRSVIAGLGNRASAELSSEKDPPVTLLIDNAPFAEIVGCESVESVLSRIAYSMWTREEIAAGTPFQFILDVMTGKCMVPESVEEPVVNETHETVPAEVLTETVQASMTTRQSTQNPPVSTRATRAATQQRRRARQ